MVTAHESDDELLPPARPLTVGVRPPHAPRRRDDRPAGRMTLLAARIEMLPPPPIGGVSEQ